MQFASTLAFPPELPAVAQDLRRQLGGQAPDLVVAFVAGFDMSTALHLMQDLRAALQPAVFLACTAEGVIGAEHEVE